MERPTKLLKTNDFTTDEEAKAYIDTFLLGNPILPKDVWIKILSGNPELSVQDINRMCSVNKTFQKLCASGNIWDKIFIREFGEKVFQQEQQREYLSENVKAFFKNYYWRYDSAVVKNFKLLRLLTFRVVEKGIAPPSFWHEKQWTIHRPRSFFKDYIDIGTNDYSSYMINFSGNQDISYNTNAAVASGLIDKKTAKYITYTLDTPFKSKLIRTEETVTKTNALQFIYMLLANKYTLNRNIMKKKIYVGQECVVCANIAEYACSRCESRFFCSDNCAKKDWMDSHMFSCI